MKKTLIALSLFGLSSAAMADVTLYGQVKAGVEVSQTKVRENGRTTKNHTITQLADFGSRIGFKGHENLGNGLNVIWKVESRTSVAGNSTGWGNRQAYIGLETTAGTIRAGKMSTQLDDMEDSTGKWENNNHALDLETLKRTSQKVLSVRYDSPVFAGFSANVQFTPRDNAVNTIRGVGATSGREDAAKENAAYYAGLNYENSGFFAQYGFGYRKAAYVTSNNASKAGQVHRVAAGYNANNLFVSGTYQYTNGWDSIRSYRSALAGDEYTTAMATADRSVGVKTHEVAVSAAYTMGNITPKASYGHGFKAKGKGLTNAEKNATEYNQVVVGADYDFSKRTTAFAQAGWLKAGKKDDKAETTAGLVGLRHKF
ncbi:Porin [Kingella potus]|uniref:Porin n=1 Tax=Kingella potus TaxID=265175 RepID=A0A377QZ92_9NEIS|nr:trimeric porin PorB [Kingella potus]STR00714.1 Porin [Kingella potus]